MTNWWPGIIALSIGAVVALVAILRGRAGRPTEPIVDEELVRLNRQIDAAVEGLRELNADRHLYDEARYASEVARLEKEAADAMRARDAHAKAPKKQEKRSATTPRKDGWGSRHPQLVGALYGGGTVLFFSIAFFLVTLEQKPAPGAATGDPRYEAVLMLSAIAISFGDSEQLLQAWELYMRQPVPRRRPPQLQRAVEWLEKTISEN